MKTFTYLLLGLFGFTAMTSGNSAQAQPGISVDVSFNRFYQELSPFGRWLDVPRYGRVWSYNEPNFKPYYSNGQWEDTDQGWSWNSGYSWGSIPFHYGRWEQDPYYGWIWIPGYDYAPAWVVWSQTDDYYGWAPLGFNCDINVSFGRIPSSRWMYASAINIGRPRIDQYCVSYERNRFYYGRQRPIVNIYTQRNVRYMGGPRRDDHYRDYPSQRPPFRDGQYSDRGGYNRGNDRTGGYGRDNNRGSGYDRGNERPGGNDRNDNDRGNQPRPSGDIRLDRSGLDHQRAIADNRPMPQDVQRRDQGGRPDNRVQHQDNRRAPEMARPQTSQSRVSPQSSAQPQRSASANRPMGGVSKDRRIF